MGKSRITSAVLVVALLVLLGGCAAGPNDVVAVGSTHVAGFWLGLWQGVISPITFIISLFNHHVNVYEVHNNGNWYNFGFMLGVSIVFSSGTHSGRAYRRPKRSRSRSGGEPA